MKLITFSANIVFITVQNNKEINLIKVTNISKNKNVRFSLIENNVRTLV